MYIFRTNWIFLPTFYFKFKSRMSPGSEGVSFVNPTATLYPLDQQYALKQGQT